MHAGLRIECLVRDRVPAFVLGLVDEAAFLEDVLRVTNYESGIMSRESLIGSVGTYPNILHGFSMIPVCRADETVIGYVGSTGKLLEDISSLQSVAFSVKRNIP